MDAEIIAVGSELLTPARLDTNSLFLTERLARRGVDVVRKVVVGDDRNRIAHEISRSRQSAGIVIVTGGLGPTLDDLSRDGAAQALERELVLHQEIEDWIAGRFRRLGRSMSENNKRQAYVIDGAEALPNPNGTAPGQFFRDDQGVLLLLPGPPRELQPMFIDECEPRLNHDPSRHQYYTCSLRIVGLGESDVDDRSGPIYAAESRAATTILASLGDVQLHVRGRADTQEEARAIAQDVADKVAEELGDHVYTRTSDPLEAVVGNLLRDKGLRLGLAESCTGGLLGERITDVAGASDYFAGSFVTYSKEAKIAWLGVREETIRDKGVYSLACAQEMAERARDACGGAGRAVGLAVTGVAGPGEAEDGTPPGSMFFGIADDGASWAGERRFGARRDRNRALAAQTALDLLRRRLSGLRIG